MYPPSFKTFPCQFRIVFIILKNFQSYQLTWYLAQSLVQVRPDGYWFWPSLLDFVVIECKKVKTTRVKRSNLLTAGYMKLFWSFQLETWYSHMSEVRPDTYWFWVVIKMTLEFAMAFWHFLLWYCTSSLRRWMIYAPSSFCNNAFQQNVLSNQV